MNTLLKKTVAVIGACTAAGLLAFVVLSGVARPQHAQVAEVPVSLVPTPASDELVQGPAAVGWVFRLAGSARDDPESGRSFSTSAEFVGVVDRCPEGSGRGGQALGVDGAGAAAQSAREAQVCLPGCAGRVPPAARLVSLPRKLELTAFQEEFDRAVEDYAPQGSASIVEWQCGAQSGRVLAAAVVALACNADECADEQLANASVYLQTESAAQLPEARAFFALRNVAKASVLGVTPLRQE